MRPPTPGRYRPLLIERFGLRNWFSPAASMVIRHIERRPLRALATTLGIASALAIIVVGQFWRDALDYMVSVQFETAQRADVEVGLVEPAASRVRHEFAHMPGVKQVEVSRNVAARLVYGHRFYRTVIQGMPRDGELRRLLDENLAVVPLPRDGLLLTDRLAERLGLKVGDRATVEL